MNDNIETVNVVVKQSKLGIEEFVSMGLELREKFDNNSWDLGDLAIMVTETLGPDGLVAVAQQIGVDIKTFRRYRDISRSYDKSLRERYHKLSWSHFKAVAARIDREAILLRADDEDWTIEKMMAMLNPKIENVIDDGKFVPPRPEFKFCEVCRKWFILDDKVLCPSKGNCMETK